MNTITIPKSTFALHPPGRFTGSITEVEDRGIVSTMFGDKHKLSIKIECDSTTAENGSKYSASQWFTISSHPKSALCGFRVMLLGRPLTQAEASNIDPEELLGRRIGYMITHSEKDGQVYANLDRSWPIDEPSPADDTEDDLPF
jgi:hypothetical protein